LIARHRLSTSDFAALARGLGDSRVLLGLRRAEVSKHLLLIRAVVTAAARDYPEEYRAADLAAGQALLTAAQLAAPRAAATVVALPQTGAWAADCLGRMRGSKAAADRPLSVDLGYFNSLAAAAAIRARQAFDLRIPLYDGALRLPTIGVARLGTGRAGEWSEVRGVRAGRRLVVAADRDGTALVILDGDPAAGVLPFGSGTTPLWTAPPRLHSTVDGLTLDVALDDGDPFLDRYARHRMTGIAATDLDELRRQFHQAWRILARQHRHYAEPVAAGLHTVVPLAAAGAAETTSATSTTAFGAVALSVPPESVVLAETLVHEFQHLKLCAVVDLVPLLGGGRDRLCYAPWRGDPRPLTGLLQGAYAYLGVTGFWRTQRRVAGGKHAFRGHVEFARWRPQTLAAIERLIGSGLLTETGLKESHPHDIQMTVEAPNYTGR
jgi:HEXXH motif-containing protein